MINKIISFIEDNGSELHKGLPNLEEYIIKHILYKTCTVIYDDDGIVALSRWNVHGDTAHILDVIIHKDKRNKGILKELVQYGHKAFPSAKYIAFEREARKDRRMRRYEIRRFING